MNTSVKADPNYRYQIKRKDNKTKTPHSLCIQMIDNLRFCLSTCDSRRYRK